MQFNVVSCWYCAALYCTDEINSDLVSATTGSDVLDGIFHNLILSEEDKIVLLSFENTADV